VRALRLKPIFSLTYLLMLRLLACLLLLLSGLWLPGQATLPATWMGEWQGPLSIFGPEGQVGQVDMSVQIQLRDSVHRYDWTITYLPADSSQPIDRRPYQLIGQRDQAGHFIMDEQNSILLDSYLFAETLSSLFQVNQSLLLVTYTYLGGDSMRFEVFPASAETPRLSGEAADVSVTSFRQASYQRATLRRQDDLTEE
jgi:hypothetical protein